MSVLSDYLRDYEARNPGFRARADAIAEEFFVDVRDIAELNPVNPSDCDQEHPGVAGPNMDISQCPKWWMPMGALRPYGVVLRLAP